MNLVLDFGNTMIKAAVFKERELVFFENFSSNESFDKLLKSFPKIDKCIIGSVTLSHQNFIKEHKGKFKIKLFEPQTKVPLKNLYKSASTLGSDRLAASVGAWAEFPTKNILVIDAGTCLKFNFTSNHGEFLGGAISPGLNMRFKALNHFTQQLPLIEYAAEFDKLIGETTEESILSGVINGFISETDGIIDAYAKNYDDLTVLVTGGNIALLVKRLKNSIFARPNLVVSGLNEILLYNS